MARLTAMDIRKLNPAERQKKMDDLFNDLTNVRIQIATGGGSENPYQIRAIKRAIARILTIQREEELKPEQ